MSPTAYHTLKNFMVGWSHFHVNPLDIRKIMSIGYRERFFCLYDPEYPYTLDIEYYNPRSVITSSPVVTSHGGVGSALSSRYVESSMMTVRYRTEDEVRQEIEAILRLQDKIKMFDQKRDWKFREFLDKNP